MNTMDSISYFTQKHCHSKTNILAALLLVVMAVAAFLGLGGLGGILCGLFLFVTTIFTVVHILGKPVGCMLLQIPLAVITFLSFFAALAMSTLGFLIMRYQGAEEYVNGILSRWGYIFAISPRMAGAFLGFTALGLFFLSFFSFCAITYLTTVKNCLNNVISRHGARTFVVSSVITAMLTAVAAVLFVTFHHGLGIVLQSPVDTSVFIEIVLLAILLLLVSLSANSFIKSTYAFKVFEEKVMKVETNADGTMYVPIKEDTDKSELSAPVPVPVPIPPKSNEKQGKPYIKPRNSLENLTTIDGTRNEYDIL